MLNENNPLIDQDLPSIFHSADRAARRGQTNYLLATKIRSISIILAAIFGMLAAVSTNFVIVTVVAFVLALAIELYLLDQKPEQAWYDGRALAESAKSIAWRFAVGAAPFNFDDGTEAESSDRLRAELARLLTDAPDISITATSYEAVSEKIRETRRMSLKKRKQIYLDGRIKDQQKWYSDKYEYNRKRAEKWRICLLFLEIVGILVAILMIIEVLRIDLTGIVASVIGVGSSWMAVRQYSSLQRAYAFASHELSIIGDRIIAQLDDESEESWAREAGDAEEAISREHKMWRASRSSFLRLFPV
ncbi:DUF4231 domain-containing protein [Glycomyces halotolerans]